MFFGSTQKTEAQTVYSLTLLSAPERLPQNTPPLVAGEEKLGENINGLISVQEQPTLDREQRYIKKNAATRKK